MADELGLDRYAVVAATSSAVAADAGEEPAARDPTALPFEQARAATVSQAAAAWPSALTLAAQPTEQATGRLLIVTATGTTFSKAIAPTRFTARVT